MKKEVAVICKAYENLFGAQIKKEIAKCEDEKAAIAYAANFIAGLNDDNAVKSRFIGEDTDVDYIIDDDELADASAKISAMVSAYETVEENDEEIFDMDSAIEDELFGAAKEINWHVSGIIETSEVCKKNGTFQEGHRYIFGGVVTMADKKDKTRYYTYKWDSMYADAYETELTSIKKADAMEIARKWSKQNGEISFEEFMAASNAEYKEIRKNYLEQAGEGGIARQYDQDLWDEMQNAVNEENAVDYAAINANINAAAVETVEVENYVEDDGSNDDPDDEVLTVDYSVDDEDEDDELVDEVEVITVEEKVVATADLEKELSETNYVLYFARNYKNSNYNHIESLKNKIKNAQLLIAKCENDIQEFQKAAAKAEKDVANLEEKAAALEAEIINRKITESYVDSIVTAAAFDASIEGEMLAAAYEPVTFELERFNDGETAIEETAEIDTSISVAEVPIVDEGAEDEYNSTLKKFNDEIANIETQIKKLQEEIIIPLQKKLEESVKQRNLHIRAMEKWVQKKIPEVTLTEYIKLHGTTTATLRKEDDCNNRLFIDGDSNGGFKISDYKKTLASYSTLKALKAAILELAAAIERGDKKFTFPADK